MIVEIKECLLADTTEPLAKTSAQEARQLPAKSKYADLELKVAQCPT
jgi:hypothetical protein